MRLPSLRLSLGGAMVCVALLTCALLGSTLYVSMHAFIRNDLRARLRNAAGVAALEVDAAAHARLRTRADEGTEGYRRIRERLRLIRSRSPDVRFIYTYRRTPDGRVAFVVDAEEDPAKVSHVGDVYEAPTPAMLEVFAKPYGAHAEKEFVSDQWGRFLSAYAPILGADGAPAAALGMDVSARDAAAFERHFVLRALAVFLAVALLVIGASLALTRRIAKPLTDLAEDMSRIRSFELDGRAAARSRIKEVAEMQTALDNMKKGLRSFKRYVPADLVCELIKLGREAHLGAEDRPLTILFTDIADFTALSESMPPDKLSECLGVYFEGMTRIILDEGGTVDKFVGDAIMAFWGAPHAVPDHAARACRAALRCREFLEDRFGRGRREGEPAFTTRFGIHTGEAYVGNFGFPERLSYTAIGDDVNLASRLEGLNKQYGTRVLVSQATLAAAGGGFAAREIDRVAVKGKAHAVAIHELAGRAEGLAAEAAAFLEGFGAAVSLYRARRWGQAADAFEALLRSRPDDGPARVLRERCRAFAAEPPPADWDGTTVLHVK